MRAFLFSIALFLSPSTVVCSEQASPGDDRGIVLAFLALKSPELADLTVFKKSLEDVFGKDQEFGDLEKKDEAITLGIDGNLCIFGMIDRPIPWADLEGPCSTAYWWEDAEEMMKEHKAHIIVSVVGDKGTRVERAILLTKLLAAAAIAHDDAVGIYWGDGTLVHQTDRFIDSAKVATLEDPPLHLWVDLRFWKDEEGKLNFVSTGMNPFGMMEVEIIGTDREPGDAFNLARGAIFLQLRGDVFGDGDTIGFDEKTKIKTSHEASIWDRPEKVLRLHF